MGSRATSGGEELAGARSKRVTPTGDLDTTFGDGGVVVTEAVPGSSEATNVVMNGSGVVVSGTTSVPEGIRPFVARYDEFGRLDTRFGDGTGHVVVDVTSTAYSEGLAVQPDGRLVVAAGTDAGVVRLTPEGRRDLNFGDQGVARFAGLLETSDLAVLADGKLVVVSRRGALVRFTTSGQPDPAFGDGGTTPTSQPWSTSLSLIVAPDGGLFVGGASLSATRYRLDGSADPGFGRHGVADAHWQGDHGDVALTRDGKVLVVATSYDLGVYIGVHLARFVGRVGSGYWLLGADGAVYTFGAARYRGRLQLPRSATAVALEPTPSGNGYWIVQTTGSINSFGDATYLAGPSVLPPGEKATAAVATPSGRGLWLFTTAGRVLVAGDAVHFGDLKGLSLNGPIVAAAGTPSGQGYSMAASDGGVFAFGDAVFSGSTGGTLLNAPVNSIAVDPDGTGYWLVAADGGVFAFQAAFLGSMGGSRLNAPVTAAAAFGDGYLLVGEDGGVFNFSSRPFHGSLADRVLTAPITSVGAQ